MLLPLFSHRMNIRCFLSGQDRTRRCAVLNCYSITYIVLAFQKDVKRNEKIFLHHIQLKTRVKLLSGPVKIFPRELMEFRGAVLNQDNGVDLPDLTIGKCLVLLAAGIPHLGILAHHQVAGITGAALTREQIPNLLNFDVD